MLPLALLNSALAKPMLVELKNGETFNGHLTNCDNFMNLTMKQVYQTSSDGERFWKLAECYIRGNTIKYIRVAEELIESVKTLELEQRQRGHLSGRGNNAGRGGANRGAARGGAQEGRGGRGGTRGRGERGARGRGN